MERDFIKELGCLGLMSRLKRLSDSMAYGVRELYKSEGLDIEPGWHLVFLLLKKHKTRTITEIAESLGMSLPGVVKMINKMKENDYIEAGNDPYDSRKRQLRLSNKAKKALPQFEKIWKAGEESLLGIVGPHHHAFLDQIEEIELRFSERTFSERVYEQMRIEQ
ncbi:MAG: helix-turn-helix domain-containing protein [Cyclobacteriaceae bacterium]